MTKIIYTIIITLCYNCLAFGQKEEIQKIQIKYIDFTTLTDSKICCDNFELAGDYKKITITNRKKITNFEKKLYCGVKDTLRNYILDSRAKIILYRKSNYNDTICVSRYGYCVNDLVIRDEKFINYIEMLIKGIDKNFSYEY